MVYSNFDKKANDLLVEFLPAVAPSALAAPEIGAIAAGLIKGLIAVLGTAAVIHSSQSSTNKSQSPAIATPSAPIDLGGGVTIGTPKETQPNPAEQQPVTLPNVEPGKPGYAVPTKIPTFRPTGPDVRPGIPETAPKTQQQTQVQTPPVIPVRQAVRQDQITQPGGPQPPGPQPPQSQRSGDMSPDRQARSGQQKGGSLPVVVPPPAVSFRSPYKKRDTIEAYPVDQQLGNINVPGTKTAYRDTFNLPSMQAFNVGLNQPPVKQVEPQGDIPNAPKSLRAKYQYRADNPNEYEGTKAFGGIANLFK